MESSEETEVYINQPFCNPCFDLEKKKAATYICVSCLNYFLCSVCKSQHARIFADHRCMKVADYVKEQLHHDSICQKHGHRNCPIYMVCKNCSELLCEQCVVFRTDCGSSVKLHQPQLLHKARDKMVMELEKAFETCTTNMSRIEKEEDKLTKMKARLIDDVDNSTTDVMAISQIQSAILDSAVQKLNNQIEDIENIKAKEISHRLSELQMLSSSGKYHLIQHAELISRDNLVEIHKQSREIVDGLKIEIADKGLTYQSTRFVPIMPKQTNPLGLLVTETKVPVPPTIDIYDSVQAHQGFHIIAGGTTGLWAQNRRKWEIIDSDYSYGLSLVSEVDLLYSLSNHKVNVLQLDQSGSATKVDSIRLQDLSVPRSIAHRKRSANENDRGTWAVTDYDGKRILLYDRNWKKQGELKKVFGNGRPVFCLWLAHNLLCVVLQDHTCSEDNRVACISLGLRVTLLWIRRVQYAASVSLAAGMLFVSRSGNTQNVMCVMDDQGVELTQVRYTGQRILKAYQQDEGGVEVISYIKEKKVSGLCLS